MTLPTDTGSRLTRGALTYGVGTSASQLLYVLALPIFTRIFAPADFGVLEFLVTLNGLLVTVGMLGMNSALFFFVNRTDEPARRREVAGTALAMTALAGSAIALGGVAVSGALAAPLLHSQEYVFALAMTFLWVPASLTTNLALDLLRLEFRPVAFSAIGLGRALLATGLGVAAAGPAGLGIAGLLAAHAFVSLLAAGAALWLGRNSWSPVLIGRWATQMLGFGLPIVPASVALWATSYSDRFLILELLGAEPAGIYAIASRGAAVLTLVVFAFEAAWWPYAFATARQPGHRTAFARTFAAVGIGLLALATFLSLFAREALLVLTTPDYLGAYALVGPLAMAAAAYGITPIVSIGLQLARKTSVFAWITGLSAGAGVLLNLALIPSVGLPGAAVATLAAHAIYLLLVFTTAQRAYPVSYPVGRVALGLPVAAGGIALGLAIDAGISGTSWSPIYTGAKMAAFVGAGAVWVGLLRMVLAEPQIEAGG